MLYTRQISERSLTLADVMENSVPDAVLEGELMPVMVRKGGRRKGYMTPDKVREKIKVGVILSYMHRQALGHVRKDSPAHRAQDIAACRALLDKVVPNVQAIAIAGVSDAPLVITTRME